MRRSDCGSISVTPSTISTGAACSTNVFSSEAESVAGLPPVSAMRPSTAKALASVLRTFIAARRSEASDLFSRSCRSSTGLRAAPAALGRMPKLILTPSGWVRAVSTGLQG